MYMQTCVYTDMYVRVYMHTHIHTDMSIDIYTHMYIHVYTYIGHTDMSIDIYTHMYIHVHTYIGAREASPRELHRGRGSGNQRRLCPGALQRHGPAYIRIHLRTHTCVCAHTSVHMYRHTYMYTCRCIATSWATTCAFLKTSPTLTASFGDGVLDVLDSSVMFLTTDMF